MKKINIVLVFTLFMPLCLSGQTLNYTVFRTPAQADAAINTLHSLYPSLTQITTIGNSFEGRPIRALKISSTPTVNNSAKGDVVFCALHHAREWITVETIIYIADRLLASYASSPALKADIDKLQIWIIPVVNPDGYLHTSTIDRMWRKNRRPNVGGTFGVDLNRNWGYQWGLTSGGSSAPANDLYFGTSPFSEPETATMRNFLNARTNLKCFVSYHSYSELYLRPWSYTTVDPSGESTLLSGVQRQIADISAVHGHTYSQTIGYTSSGEATDWVWNEKRVAAFTPELRPTTAAAGGFAPPATEILPCAQENYPAAVDLIHDAAYTGLFVRDNAGDTGAEPSTGTFWTSPDISSTPAVLTLGSLATLNVHINNNTGAVQNNVTVEAYYTDPRITLEFPSLTSIPIGTRTITVPIGGTTITIPWTTPSTPNIWGEPHWCVGVVVKHAKDMPLTTVVNRSNNVACKNFDFLTVATGGLIYVAATNFLSIAAELKTGVIKDGLPLGWQIDIAQASSLKDSLKTQPSSLRKAKLLKTTGLILEPGETVKIPIRISGGIVGSEGTVNIMGELIPLVAGERKPIANGFTYSVKIK